MKNWKTWVIVALAAVLALVGSLTVLADDPETPEAMGRGGMRAGKMGAEARWRPEEGEFQQGWADELGVTVDRLTEAAETAWSKLIDQAVADGELTEEEAEAMAERPAPFAGGRGGRGDGGLLSEVITQEEQQAFMADLLGMTTDELQAKLDESESLRDLIAEAELDAEAVREATEAFRTDEINKAVEEGILTEDQAEQLLSGPQAPRSERGGQGGPGGQDARRGSRGAPPTDGEVDAGSDA